METTKKNFVPFSKTEIEALVTLGFVYAKNENHEEYKTYENNGEHYCIERYILRERQRMFRLYKISKLRYFVKVYQISYGLCSGPEHAYESHTVSFMRGDVETMTEIGAIKSICEECVFQDNERVVLANRQRLSADMKKMENLIDPGLPYNFK